MFTCSILSAFIAEKPSLQHIAKMDPDCQLDVVGQSFAKSSWSFSLPKGSPWTETISQATVDLKSFLHFEDIYEKWKDRSSCVHGKMGFSYMKLTDLAGLFSFLAVFLCLFLVCVVASIALKKLIKVCQQRHDNLHVSCNAVVLGRSGQFHVNTAVIEAGQLTEINAEVPLECRLVVTVYSRLESFWVVSGRSKSSERPRQLKRPDTTGDFDMVVCGRLRVVWNVL